MRETAVSTQTTNGQAYADLLEDPELLILIKKDFNFEPLFKLLSL